MLSSGPSSLRFAVFRLCIWLIHLAEDARWLPGATGTDISSVSRETEEKEREGKEGVEREKRRNEEEPWNIMSLLHPYEGHLSHMPISGLMIARGKRCTNLRVNI